MKAKKITEEHPPFDERVEVKCGDQDETITIARLVKITGNGLHFEDDKGSKVWNVKEWKPLVWEEEDEHHYQIGTLTDYGYVVDQDESTGRLLICAGPEYEFSADWDNAKRIVDQARFCGFDGWFVPTKKQLNLVCVRLHMENLGGFADDGYWSSSEYGSDDAWYQTFGIGDQYYDSKLTTRRVRAVRWFTGEELKR